jgi:hypothetical protein
MSDRAQAHPRKWLWRLLTLGGLLIGASALLRRVPGPISARGRHQTPPSGEALRFGYEAKDIGAKTTAYILLTIAGITTLAVCVVFFMVWRADLARREAFADLTTQQTTVVTPPLPHLQVDAWADIAANRAREEALLHGYGWTAPDHSTARIPIDRAMAMTVGKSLDASP